MLYCNTYVVSPVDPLKYLMAKQHLFGRFVKGLMLLQEFDINVVKKKFVKGQAIVDLIAYFPQGGKEVVHKEFPNIFEEEPWCQRLDDLSTRH